MPGGSKYEGPSEALERFTAVVNGAGEPVKGAKNPCTSRNGHITAGFLDREGGMALRLSKELADEFTSSYESGPVIVVRQRDAGLPVPNALLDDSETLTEWFRKSCAWIGTLEPKPTKK